MKLLHKFFKSMLSSNGEVSTMRVCTISIVMTILGIYISSNIVAMVKELGYQDFPTNTVMVLLVVLGAKVGQHVSENVANKRNEENDGVEKN